MRQFGYYFFKGWMTLSLKCYYSRLTIFGLENVPKNKPVLFLSNHQNALLDILLIATKCDRKPWYLTRADVFKGKFFRPLFKFLQMIPIYRIRDGRSALAKNQAVFDTCGELLTKGEAILLFPEANHSLKRRVRPLSKGFTRIIENALQKDPNLDLQLVPVGQNYQYPEKFGDRAALYYGRPIAVQDFKEAENFVEAIKLAVFEALTQLTTHIANESTYEHVISALNANRTDFCYPQEVNQAINSNRFNDAPRLKVENFAKARRSVLYVINFPLVLLWRVWLKPKVPEPEFTGTYRFGFCALAVPLFYFGIYLFFNPWFAYTTILPIILAHFLLSLAMTKLKL